MRSFNRGRRVFCALLSTRSRAPGVGLVEADAVVFYDHDLNPVLDAQAQQWCDRIGRRKDVHVYRCGPRGVCARVRRSAQCGAASSLLLKAGAGAESGVGWSRVGPEGEGQTAGRRGSGDLPRGPATCCVGGGRSGCEAFGRHSEEGPHRARSSPAFRRFGGLVVPAQEALRQAVSAALCCPRSPVVPRLSCLRAHVLRAAGL